MKLTGLTGTGSGKLGSSVFSVSAGEQIVRQYQPVVTNPSTNAQVNNRARLKLLSQLSAVMGDVIAIPRAGAQSPRNLFVKDNYPLSSSVNGVASINLASISITRGGMQIPAVVAERVDTTSVNVALAAKADQLVARVIYVMFMRNAQGELQLIDSAIVETAGVNGTFPYAFAYVERDVIVYAYGIFDKNAKATAKFGNYGVTTGTQVASLVADRKISDTDYLLTKTQGILLAGVTHIEVNSVVCNTINVPASGITTIPYDNSVAVEVSAVDVEGKVLSLLVDGVRGEMRAFPASGETYVGAFDLVGGENIRVQIGHMDNTTFVAEYQYGGTIVIGAQATAFTSVTANGLSIANAGNTQVAIDSEIEIAVSAAGVIGKYLRVSVNGVAQAPVAFVGGVADTGVINPAVGNTITFQIGRVVNGTFVEDVAYGGTAVVAEVPPVFSSVSVNNQSIAASGNTNVVLATPNTIVVGTQNAAGKYLAILNGNNEVLSVHAISGASTQVTQNYSANDVIKFAIGTGSSTSSFVAQTNFGGSVTFIDAPVVHISNLVVDGQSVDNDVTIASGSRPYSGNTDLSGAGNTMALVIRSATKPSVGNLSSAPASYRTISNGAFNGSFSATSGNTYWFCIGVWDDDAEDGSISYVYDFNATCQ